MAYQMESVYMFSLLEFLTTKQPSFPWGGVVTRQQNGVRGWRVGERWVGGGWVEDG